MSLHNLAHHLQSAGRGEDKVLVHMTPGEVKGLQSLAMAHGGSLTVNPETGLPEAGILKSLLPMLAGFALGPAGLGMTALNAGLTTAAVGTAATGSLKKGLMAGLGAYSGAGLGAGLQSMAAPATAPAVPGLSPSVAANTSALGGTSQFAKVGAENALTSADDLLMQGAKNVPPGFNPRASSVFVQNVPNVAPPPVDAAKFLGTDTTNQAVLGKLGYTGPGSLPTAAGGPRPFAADFPTVDVAPTVNIRPPADTYFDPSRAYDPSGSLSGSRAAADVRGFGAQRDYSKGLLGRKGDIVDIVGDEIVPHSSALTSPPNVSTIGLRGTPPADAGPYDMARVGTAAPRGETVIAKNLPPLESKTSYVPIERRTATLLEKPTIRSEILPGDAPLAQPRSISEPFRDRMSELGRGAKASFGSVEGLKGLYAASEAAAPYGMYAGLGSTAYSMYDEERQRMEDEARARAEANRGLIRPYTFDYGVGGGENVSAQPYSGSAERTYFQPTYTAGTPYKAPGPEYAASGGLMGYAAGGPIEQMADMNAVGMNTGYPMANLQTPMYSNPGMQRPEATNVIAPSADAGVGAYSGEQRFARGGTAEPQSSGYSYDYDPKSMMFTQTGGPGVSGGLGGFGRGIITGPESFALTSKQYDAAMAAKNAQQATPDGTVSGGIATPMMRPAAPMQSFAPTTTVPAYQTPEQQLGLGGFYNMMNQQMGGYGGYAAGGNVGGGVSHLGDYSDGGRLLKGPGDGVSDSIPASIGNRQPARLADGEFVVPARIVSEIGNGSTEAGARKLYAMMDRVQKARRKTTGKNQVARNTKAERLLPA